MVRGPERNYKSFVKLQIDRKKPKRINNIELKQNHVKHCLHFFYDHKLYIFQLCVVILWNRLPELKPLGADLLMFLESFMAKNKYKYFGGPNKGRQLGNPGLVYIYIFFFKVLFFI